MDYFTTMGSFNLDAFLEGSDTTSPLDDNAWGDTAMETSTPTGNGSGAFLDSGWQNQIFGGLSKVVDYAIQRDAVKMQAKLPQVYQPATAQQVQVQGKQTNFMFLALCGLGIYLVASRGGK